MISPRRTAWPRHPWVWLPGLSTRPKAEGSTIFKTWPRISSLQILWLNQRRMDTKSRVPLTLYQMLAIKDGGRPRFSQNLRLLCLLGCRNHPAQTQLKTLFRLKPSILQKPKMTLQETTPSSSPPILLTTPGQTFRTFPWLKVPQSILASKARRLRCSNW